MTRRFRCVILVCVLGLSRCIQVSGLSYPVAFYPFNNEYKASDVSCYRNKQGRVVGAKLTTGPNGVPNSAYDFAATKTNYIELPGSLYTDTKYSMTIVVWVYHSGFSGPIVDYADDDFGVNLWMTGKDTLHGRIISRDGNTNQFLSSNRIGLQYSWHYVGIGYDYSTGIAKLWVNGIKVQEIYVGNVELKTVGLLRLGALDSDDRYFRGKISCLQIYDKALTASEILVAKTRCKNAGLIEMDCTKQGNTECGGIVSSESGTITSPRYPREYPPNTKCIWKLQTPKGKRIIIQFRNIDLEKENYNCGDYIEVYDGFNTWSTRLVKYCKSPTDKPYDLSSKSNKMKIVFQSNGDHHGKGFSAFYISEDQVKPDTKESNLDLSVHYTGIVIGVACAALLTALTIIAINHNKQSRRRRSSTMSSRRSRRSESFSYTDTFGAPPSYDIVMRCPELYPPSPQMTPVPSTGSSTPVRNIRFTTRHQRQPPLASPASSRYICNSSSEDSDEEHPPPAYPGVNAADFRKLQQQINQLANNAQNTNSQTLSSTDDGDHQLTDSTSSDSGQNGSQLVNQSLPGTEEENIEHVPENLENELQSTSCENSDTMEQSTLENQEQCICSILDNNGRERVDTQSSIVGTVV